MAITITTTITITIKHIPVKKIKKQSKNTTECPECKNKM
jgi:hypothetical protein